MAQPSVTTRPSTNQLLQIAPSLAAEVYWSSLLDREGRLVGTHPDLAQIQASRPELIADVRQFWDEPINAFGSSEEVADPKAEPPFAASLPEVLVLADLAGELTSTDLGRLVAGLTRASEDPLPPALALSSEADTTRRLVRHRLARLRRSPRLRRRHVELVEAWARALRPSWYEHGQHAVAVASRERRQEAAQGETSALVMNWVRCEGHAVLLARLLAASIEAGTPILVTPVSLAGGKTMFFDLPHHLLIGIPAGDAAAESRFRSAELANRLKALADPTRLAIVDRLAGQSRTVGELATEFQLAQPTVSKHVKVLRQAGVLTEVRQAGARPLRADRAAVVALLDEVKSMLGSDQAPTQSTPTGPQSTPTEAQSTPTGAQST